MENTVKKEPRRMSWAQETYFRFRASNRDRDEIRELAYLLGVSQSEAVRRAVSDKLRNVQNSAPML